MNYQETTDYSQAFTCLRILEISTFQMSKCARSWSPQTLCGFFPAEKTLKVDMGMAGEAIRKVHKGKEIPFEMLIR